MGIHENWREWSPDTTDRGGRERGLEAYEGYLGFSREELKGKTILEIGSGETERFSRQLKEVNIDAKVVALNPDYAKDRYREKIHAIPDWAGKSVAATGQELPFNDETFDKVFGLFSLTVFASPSSFTGNPEATKHWLSEIIRVLKHGGEARLAPMGGWRADTQLPELYDDYRPLVEYLQDQGLELRFEAVKNKDLGYTRSTTIWMDKRGQQRETTEDVGERVHDSRMIIRKP